MLYADGPCSTDGQLLNISLQFLPCPPGFSLSSSETICGCEPRLQKYTTRCNITERTITHEGEYWVGYDNSSQALILHPYCPFDYCKPATNYTSFPLNKSQLVPEFFLWIILSLQSLQLHAISQEVCYICCAMLHNIIT